MTAATTIQRNVWGRGGYDHLIAARAFDRIPSVQRVKGEIWQIAPPGHRHADAVSLLNKVFSRVLITNDDLWVRPQPVAKHPTSHDPHLTLRRLSLEFDRTVKFGIYAVAGIPETWILDLNTDHLCVYRNPFDGMYRSESRLAPEDSIRPLFAESINLRVIALCIWSAGVAGQFHDLLEVRIPLDLEVPYRVPHSATAAANRKAF